MRERNLQSGRPLTYRMAGAMGGPRHTLTPQTDSSIVRVIILAAGQGRRLLPLTADTPKALLDIAGKPLIMRQIEAFAQHGLRDFTVVTGYAAARMEDELAEAADSLGVSISTLFNPFYSVADNLASCWMARSAMTGDFIQVNGDNVFGGDLVERLLAAPKRPASVAVNTKASYDADDMKVMLRDGKVMDIGKGLDVSKVHAEANGFYVFRGEGVSAYADILDRFMREPSGLKQWFPSAVAGLAQEQDVNAISLDGIRWAEVDFPADYEDALKLARSWF
jgi:L-glutamine-phosphate cytidylyltransferase